MTTTENAKFATNADDRTRGLLTKVAEAIVATKYETRVCVNINDYRPDDQAEVKLRLAVASQMAGTVQFVHTFAGEYDTLAASYYAETEVLGLDSLIPKGAFGYVNVAPIEASDIRNGSHPFLGVLLSNGRLLFAPNSYYSLSLIAPYAKVIWRMPCATNGEQFRSWRCFPIEIGRIFRLDFTNVDQVWSGTDDHPIPKPPADRKMACVDNFGNVKTLYKVSDADRLKLADGDIVEVLVKGKVVAEATYGRNVRKLSGPRLLSLAAGSGLVQANADAPVGTYLDLFRLRDRAVDLIGNPGYEDSFSIRKKSKQELDIALFDRGDVVHRTGNGEGNGNGA